VTATLAAVGVAAAAATIALKGAFAIPRPVGAAEAGYAFPSGHAFGAAAVYGAAALSFDRLDRRKRYAVAAAVAAVVALSRLVIGVHVLPDVVAGAAGGLTLAWLLVRLSPSHAFAVATALAVPAVLLGGPTTGGEAAALLGGGLGGGLAWYAGYGRGSGAVAPRVVVPVVLLAAAAVATVDTLPLPPAVAASFGAVAVGLVVGMPGLVARAGGEKERAG
jgi:hypothetical protein